MSKGAHSYVAGLIPKLRAEKFCDKSGKVRGFGETGAWMLFFLSSHLNKDGTFFMTVSTIREETGTATNSEVIRILYGLEQLGYIARTGQFNSYRGRGMPTPVYAMICIPGLYKGPIANQEIDSIASPIDIPGVEQIQRKHQVQEGLSDNSLATQPEPQIELKIQIQPESDSETQRNRGESEIPTYVETDRATEIFSLCIEFEKNQQQRIGKPVKPGLERKWHAEYPSLIANEIDAHPESSNHDLAWETFSKRHEERTWKQPSPFARHLKDQRPQVPSPLKPKTQPLLNCPLCEGRGYYLSDPTRISMATKKCHCNEPGLGLSA